MRTKTAEVIVAGGGVIGLCSALAIAERGIDVLVVSEPSSGEASRAAAGMLAPSVERASAEPDAFGIAARDRYPSYLESLADRSGVSVPLNRLGILQIALSQKGIKGLQGAAGPESSWLNRDELSRLEPLLSHALGAVHNPLDGCVDNAALVDALTKALGNNSRIASHLSRVTSVIATGRGISARTRDGESISGSHVIIAAGAWSGAIEGAGFARAVTPVRGQLVAFEKSRLSHVVYGPRGYLVPRNDTVIGGSTMEHTGFDASITETGTAKVAGASGEICPTLSLRKITHAWAGLRPVTPDLRPIIGPAPETPEIIYACGHGRNGILMAPLTGDLVADLVTGSPLPHELVQFRPDRF